jgi:hypothetical protein
MTRINLFRTMPFRNTSALTPSIFRSFTLDSVAWGKINLGTTASPLVFAAILIVCSFAVGCSSEKPKTESSITPPVTAPITQPPATAPSTPAPLEATAKPVHKKHVRRIPPTVTYADAISGVSFQYPRKFTLKSGDSVNELVASNAISMNFVQPGGVAVAAVKVPEGVYPKSDLASAMFDVSVNKSLTGEQCAEFPVAQKPQAAENSPQAQADAPAPASKLMIGDLELQSNETTASGEASEQTTKYYHVFENGACYEFALEVATTKGETEEGTKPVDRKEVFTRLERILATVKIIPAPTAPVTAESTSPAPAAPATTDSATPAAMAPASNASVPATATPSQ